MKRIIAAFGLVAAVTLLAAPASAQNRISDQPAATLLLPYFEVNIAKPAKLNTFLSVNNASASAVLAHLTVWSDLSVPVLAFNIYLTGYDVQNISMADVLNGVLPRTASDGQDPSDTISPQGLFSQDINFASCNGQLPIAPLPQSYRDHLRNSLTGKASAIYSGLCSGVDHHDSIARGYVTIDTVNNCTLRFSGDAGYFGPGGTGDATNQNILWGDFSIVNSAQKQAWGDALVHITASATDPETSVAGQYTFYGRYDNFTAADDRHALATNFAVRYRLDAKTSTSVVAWRDPKVDQQPFVCPAVVGVRPSWYPLGMEGLVIFDDQERPFVPSVIPVSPQPPQMTFLPFPAATQSVEVNSHGFEVPFTQGWLYVNLNTVVSAAGSNPPEDPAAAQAWLATSQEGTGFVTGGSNVQLDSAETASHFTPN